MALGAQRADVLNLVVRYAVELTIIGVAIGLSGALALTRFLSGLLFGVQPIDPPTLAVVSVLLTAVALLASLIPALRATRVSPLVALHHE
jgi:putative ABC transport system permease protein